VGFTLSVPLGVEAVGAVCSHGRHFNYWLQIDLHKMKSVRPICLWISWHWNEQEVAILYGTAYREGFKGKLLGQSPRAQQ
jgi:hypothetical protein